ncbi:MAG TPA: hypothetical protein EYP80_00395 [Candidatus Aenigmarchaeota archaeon]|nr:hypothetical protein [Candidatus Aenigmarchaeota archaeon]
MSVGRGGRELDKIKPHYYCVNCGAVEYRGPDRAKKYGYFANVLGEIRRFFEMEARKGGKFKLTAVVTRLMLKEIESIDGFDDTFSRPFSAQKAEFIRILKKYFPSFTEDFFESFFDPQPPVYSQEDVNYYGKYYEELEEKYKEESHEEEESVFFR